MFKHNDLFQLLLSRSNDAVPILNVCILLISEVLLNFQPTKYYHIFFKLMSAQRSISENGQKIPTSPSIRYFKTKFHLKDTLHTVKSWKNCVRLHNINFEIDGNPCNSSCWFYTSFFRIFFRQG